MVAVARWMAVALAHAGGVAADVENSGRLSLLPRQNAKEPRSSSPTAAYSIYGFQSCSRRRMLHSHARTASTRTAVRACEMQQLVCEQGESGPCILGSWHFASTNGTSSRRHLRQPLPHPACAAVHRRHPHAFGLWVSASPRSSGEAGPERDEPPPPTQRAEQ